MAENNNRINPADCFDTVKTKGRTRQVLNATGAAVVMNMAAVMCTQEEIAAQLYTTVETLTNKTNRETFLDAYKVGRERGKWSLRRYQFELAKKSSAMAIFLGKNYLGQSDDAQIKTEYEDLKPLADLLKENTDDK